MIWKLCGKMWLIILIFSTICVRTRSWGCLHRQKQKKSLQRKNKKDSLEFQSELSKMSLLYQMVGVVELESTTSTMST